MRFRHRAVRWVSLLSTIAAFVAVNTGCGGDDDDTSNASPGGSSGSAGSGGSTAGNAGSAGAAASGASGSGGTSGSAGSSGSSGSSGTGGSSGSGGSGLPMPKCEQNVAPWATGTKIFEEKTMDWGLADAKVEGVRLAAVDYDGDGWPDLVVRRGGGGPDDFSDGGVRQTWLLKNNGSGRFEDKTVESNIRQNRTETDPNKGRPGEVFAFADVDNDGDLDVFTGSTNTASKPQVETSELMLNNGDGTFSLGDESNEFRIAVAKHNEAVAGVSFIDVDRDGFVDVWVAHNSSDAGPLQDHLYKNDGTGKFTDITEDSGLKTYPWIGTTALNNAQAHSNAWSATACDLNNDGNAELLAASYGRAPNHLWQNGGKDNSFAFTNQSIASGYAFDDNQDWSDNESARCWCKLHPTDDGCDGVPAPMYIQCLTDDDAFRWNHPTDRDPYRLGGNSGTTVCADIDNDGNIDLLTSEIVHWDVGASSDHAELMFNNGTADVTFVRPGREETGIEVPHSGVDWNEGIMTGGVFDFDNDGWPDVYIGASDYPGNRGLLFHQTSARLFEAVPIEDGIDHHRSHGLAIADFDRDGDLDIVLGHSLARCSGDSETACYSTAQVRFFENVMPKRGNFIQVSLTGGANTNRSAIGARVTVKSGDVTQTQEVGGGHGHYGIQHDLTLHFGIGASCEAEVTVRWPDADLSEETMTLPAGYRFTWTQGEQPKAVQ